MEGGKSVLSEKDKNKLSFIIKLLYLVAIIGIIYFFLKYALGWALPFLIAFGISLIADPIINIFTNKLRWKRSIASTLVVALILILAVFLVGLLSTTLFVEVKGVFSNIDLYLNQIVAYVQELPAKYGHLFDGKVSTIINECIDFLQNYDYSNLLSGSLGSGALKYAGSLISSLPSALVFLIVTIVATFFMSASFPVIKSFIMRQFNERTRELILDVKHYFVTTIFKYLKSYFILWMITFAELSVAFLIFGFKPPITLAFVISLVDILPILGVGTVLIPWFVVELVMGNPIRAIIIICIYLVITVVRQTLEPKIIGDHVGLLPIVTLFCIYIGLQLFGVLGMFMLPITVTIIKNLQDNHKIKIWKE